MMCPISVLQALIAEEVSELFGIAVLAKLAPAGLRRAQSEEIRGFLSAARPRFHWALPPT